ncbi:MAG: T9SS type A sorting domain-containing protein [Polaribacter sp.]|nr:T9SS type A sorting domain-containing protein [Polaribacter sp.]
MKKNYFITLLILCFSLSSFGQEMALNSGFEAWDDSTTPTDWTKAENITQSNDAQSGTFSALRDGGTGTKDLSQTITGVIAGDSYTISLWYKVTAGDGTDARIWSYWKDGSGGSVTDADTDGALRGPDASYLDNNGGVWTEYTATVVAPATTEAFYFEVRSYSGSVVYWDNLSFVHNTTSSSPAIAITAPTDGATIDATTSVDVAISVTDFAVGTTDAGLDGHIHWTIQENSDAAVDQPMKYNTDAETISVTPGNSYTVYMELVDNSHAVISPAVNTSTTFTVAPAEPTDAAPTPPARETGDVVSLFSDAYTDVTLTELPTDWSDLTTFEATTVAGDNVWKLSGLEFLGMVTNYDTGIDVSTMEKLHIDYWVPTGVENELFVKIVNTIDGGEDLESLGTTVSGSWQSIDLDMTGFDGGNLANKEKITQILFDSDGRAATVYVDNFYFYKEATAGIDDQDLVSLNMYPNPASDVLNISAQSTINSVEIFNVLGQKVITMQVENTSAEINVSNLNAGIYLIKYEINNSSSTKKFVKN